MPYDFTGKRVLVTGAGKGIGRSLVVALAKNGCHVYALSRTQADLDSLEDECPGIKTILADVSDWDNTRAKLEQLETMDGLVNNAGIDGGYSSCLDSSKELLDKVLAINLLGAINCMQVIGQKMLKDGRSGSIVNVSSIFGLRAYSQFLAYNVSKAGMDMATKQFALELGPKNIRVNSVNPTLVMTPATQKFIDEGTPFDEIFTRITPLGRVCKENEITSPIMYLLSDESSMVTGTCHVVDGGLLSHIAV